MNRNERKPGPRRGSREERDPISDKAFQKFRLGDFLVESVLGKGAMGIVFRARDLTLNRDVALKVLTSALNRVPDARRRFLDEARAAASLNHVNIIRVHHVGADPKTGRAFLSMELIEGMTLSKRLQKDDLSFGEIIRITTAVARGLQHAWQNGLVHRDVKPGNVMLTPEGEVKLLDFGLAQKPEQGMAVAGTPDYMSPEQAEGRKVDCRSDLYALGVVLYEMLAGSRPFAGGSLHQIQYLHAFGQPRRLSLIRKNVSPSFEGVLLKLLAKNRDNRYGGPGELIEALQQLADALRRQGSIDDLPMGPVIKPVMTVEAEGTTREFLDTKVVSGTPRRRPALLAWVVAAILALGGGLGGWWWMQTSRALPGEAHALKSELRWSQPQEIWTVAPDGTTWRSEVLPGQGNVLVCRGGGSLRRALSSENLQISGALVELGASSAGLFLESDGRTVWGLGLRRIGAQPVLAVELQVETPDGAETALAIAGPVTDGAVPIPFNCYLFDNQILVEVEGRRLVWELLVRPDALSLRCTAEGEAGVGFKNLRWQRGFRDG